VIKYIFQKIRLISNYRKEPYFLFYNVLGFYPDKIAYYQLAVRHKSVSIPTDEGHLLSNERLEFLGDAVLGSVVTDILYHKYTDQREGFLTNTRSKIVKRDALNLLALNIGLDKLVRVTKYVNKNTNNNIYGNALEALVGAIYLDFGYKKCKLFIENCIAKKYIDLEKVAEDEVNFKSKLIEWCQKYHFPLEFVLINDTLIKANKHEFQIRVLMNQKEICEGVGSSKKESQQNAANVALQMIESQVDFIQNILLKVDEPTVEIIEEAAEEIIPECISPDAELI
jgi:ribonuclease-3